MIPNLAVYRYDEGPFGKVVALPDILDVSDAHRREQERQIAEGVAADIYQARTEAAQTQDEVASRFGRGRAWINKLEVGRIKEVSLSDYLQIMVLLHGTKSDHPAVRLHSHLGNQRRKLRVNSGSTRT